jgi:hypothetical protein
MVVKKECPPDKILNPETDRCVSKTGTVGKKILLELLNKNKNKNKPKSQKEIQIIKECPHDKILNPETERCVSKTGAIGKKILLELLNKNKNKNKPESKPKSKPKSQKEIQTTKECPDDKILNPETDRCVSKTGAIGKKILSELLNKNKNKPESKPKKETPESKRKNDYIIYDNDLDFRKLTNEVRLLYGNPHVSGITEINQQVKDCFDMNSVEFISKNLDKFINSSNERIQYILKKILNNTIAISLSQFLKRLIMIIYQFICDFKNSKIFLYAGNINDNNKWIIRYVNCMFKCITNGQFKINVINKREDLINININDTVIIVDDCYYTGHELDKIIENDFKFNIKTKQFNLFLMVPFMSNIAMNKIKSIFNHNYSYSKLIFANHTFNKLYNLGYLYKTKDLKYLDYYYGLDAFKMKFDDKYPIFFQHNIASDKSVITPIYSGIVGNSSNAKLLIKYKFYDLFESDKEKVYKKLEVVPIVKGCTKYNFILNIQGKCETILYSKISKMALFHKEQKEEVKDYKLKTVDVNKNSDFVKSNKKIIESVFGKPYKFKLSNLLKDNFVAYPLDHSFNKNAVNKFLRACDAEVRDICYKLILNTEHISFELFLNKINECIYELLVYYINQNPKITKYTRPLIIYNSNYKLFGKSNYWIYTYIVQFIKYITNDNVRLELWNGFDDIGLVKNDFIVMIDDCIYSGSQMGGDIMSLYNPKNIKINLYLLVPFISEVGEKRVISDFKHNSYLYKSRSKLIFAKNVHKPKIIDNVLTEKEFIIFNDYYKAFIYLKGKSLIYFDHKLADVVSTITPFYLGIVPSKQNLEILKTNFNVITDINQAQNVVKTEEIYEYLNIIPIINNCDNHTSKLNLMSPICPAPPYKTTFKNFMQQLIKQKKLKKEYNQKSLDNNIQKRKKLLKHSY